jgi:hypothetical protein
LGRFIPVKTGDQNILKQILSNNMQNIADNAENADNDRDGLKKWEEVIWKTDISKSDTDGDGFTDGEEVAAGYDPLDSASNQKTLKKNPTQAQLSQLDFSSSVNLTDKLAESISKGIVNSGGLQNLNDSGSANLLNQGISGKETAEFIAEFHIQIPKEELKVSPDNSPLAIKKYYSSVSEIMMKDPLFFKSSNPFVSNDGQINFSFVSDYVKYYGTAIISMKNIVVPSDFFSIHKQWIELAMANKRALEALGNMEKDPLMAILAIQQGERITQEMADLMIKLSDLFKKYL